MIFNPKELSNKEKHYLLWEYLARTGEQLKQQAMLVLFGQEEVDKMLDFSLCYGCKEARENREAYEKETALVDRKQMDVDEISARCDFCPISSVCMTRTGAFFAWNSSKTAVEDRKILAADIRDALWREAK